jgi:hypothetical protein
MLFEMSIKVILKQELNILGKETYEYPFIPQIKLDRREN